MTTATQRMTADELFDWFRCNAGWIVANYASERRKGYVCSHVAGALWEDDPTKVRGPDVCYYDTPKRYSDLTPRYSDEVPTLVVEVLSPNDKAGPVNVRLSEFLAWGVRLVWLIDPDERIVIAYRPNASPQVFRAGQELLCEEVLPGFRCRVDDLFYLPGEQDQPPAS